MMVAVEKLLWTVRVHNVLKERKDVQMALVLILKDLVVLPLPVHLMLLTCVQIIPVKVM